MAIVSISRIQIRRGKESVDGLPQLAGGELAWAVDTQKLYVGNGAVSEGAPAVGNTELLSTKSNLFDLADQYQYKKDVAEPSTGNPEITRTLQERLDESVTVRSFGAEGDNTDQTVKIQKAIDELFANTNKSSPVSRVILKVPAGEYRLSNSIKIPPHTNVVGEGSDKTVFIQTSNNPIFETVNDLRTTSSDGDQTQTTTLNQAREIRLEGMTLETSGSNIGLLLTDCSNSEFKDIKIKSDWVSGASIDDNNIGISLVSQSTNAPIANCAKNIFNRIRIEGFSYAVKSLYTSLMIDNVFSNGTIDMCGYGISLGEDTSQSPQSGLTNGPKGNNFISNKFTDIDKNGMIIFNGEQNTSSKNSYVSVGNDGGTDGGVGVIESPTPTFAVIDFKSVGNKSEGDFFARTHPMAVNSSYAVGFQYVPEITGHHSGEFNQTLQVEVPYTQTAQTIFRLPSDVSKNIEISYVFKSRDYDNERTGSLSINVDKQNDTVSIDDEFRYSGTQIDPHNPIFTAQLGEANNNTLFILAEYSLLNDLGTLNLSIRSTF
jgi:hypothetical protein